MQSNIQQRRQANAKFNEMVPRAHVPFDAFVISDESIQEFIAEKNGIFSDEDFREHVRRKFEEIVDQYIVHQTTLYNALLTQWVTTIHKEESKIYDQIFG